MRKALFEGLIADENDNLVTVAYVGEEPCYVVNDAGFHRHISSEEVDRQVLHMLGEQIEGHEEEISQQTAKMLGQEDIFTQAMLLNQIKQMDRQFEALLQTGIPADARAYLGMMGFKVVIDMHGEILRVDQPSAPARDDE